MVCDHWDHLSYCLTVVTVVCLLIQVITVSTSWVNSSNHYNYIVNGKREKVMITSDDDNLASFLRYSTSHNGVSLKYWLTVIQAHWKWQHSINQYYTTSYHCSSIFKTVDVEDYHDLEIQVRGHSPCGLMHDMYIAKIYRCRTVFSLLIVHVYLHSLLHSDKAI